MKDMLLSVCIPTYNRVQFLKFVIDNIVKSLSTSAIGYEIIVCDSDSKDGTVEYANEILEVKYFNIPPSNNNSAFLYAARHAKGKYVVLINDHTFLKMDNILCCINDMEKNPDIGCVPFSIAAGGLPIVGRKPFEMPSFNHVSGLILNHLLIVRNDLIYLWDDDYSRNEYDFDLMIQAFLKGYSIGFNKYVLGYELKFDNGLSPSDSKSDFLYNNRNNRDSNLQDEALFNKKFSVIIDELTKENVSGVKEYIFRLILRSIIYLYNKFTLVNHGRYNCRYTIDFEELTGLDKIDNYHTSYYSFFKNNNRFLYWLYIRSIYGAVSNRIVEKSRRDSFYLVQKLKKS